MSVAVDASSDTEEPRSDAFVGEVVRAVLRRPSLWLTALLQAGDFAPRGWWSRKPFLPLPDAKYLEFRLETQYGAAGRPEASHVVEYLEWCRAMRNLRRQAR